MSVPPLELGLEIRPRARLDVIDVRGLAAQTHGNALAAYPRCLYASRHTTAGFLPQGLAARLNATPDGIGRYLELFRTVFPESAGYLHDQLELRHELAPDQKLVEPVNAHSHLAFIGGGLRPCVSYNASKPGPVYLDRSRRDARGRAAHAADDDRGVSPRDDRRADVAARAGLAAPHRRSESQRGEVRAVRAGRGAHQGARRHKGARPARARARRAVREPDGERIRDAADAARPRGGAAQPAALCRRARAPRVERSARGAGQGARLREVRSRARAQSVHGRARARRDARSSVWSRARSRCRRHASCACGARWICWCRTPAGPAAAPSRKALIKRPSSCNGALPPARRAKSASR